MINYWCEKCLRPIDSEYLDSRFEPSSDEYSGSNTEHAEIECSFCNSPITFDREAFFSDAEPELITGDDGSESVAPPEVDYYEYDEETGVLCLNDMGNAIVDKIDNHSANFTSELLMEYLEDFNVFENVIEQIKGILEKGCIMVSSTEDNESLCGKKCSDIKNPQRIMDLVESMKTYVKEKKPPEKNSDELFV